MSVDPLYTSDVFTDNPDTSLVFTYSDLEIPDEGDGRALVVSVMITSPSSGETGDPGLIQATFGDMDMVVAGVERFESMTALILYCFIDSGASVLAGNDLVIDLSGTNVLATVNVTAQAFVFANAEQSDVDAVVSSGSSTSVSGQITPEALGDLVFTFATRTGLDSGPKTWDLSGTDSADYTLEDPTDFGDFINSDGDGKGGRSAYSNEVDTAQGLHWTRDGTGGVSIVMIVLAQCDTTYNCDCDVDPDARTLEQMRTDTLAVSGYSSQLANVPSGVRTMYNGFINLAQRWVYSKLRAMETTRFFTWQLEPGVRYYGLRDTTNCCTVQLNRYKIEGAWVQDLNNTWWPLIYGIDPTFYTLDRNYGWPNYFEVRQCVEVFPAPQAAYKLRIKGHFQLLPLEEDYDTTTLPSSPVLNRAIYLAKAHKGMTDANVYRDAAEQEIADLVYGKHVTRRYIPGTAEIPVPTPPIMVRFDS